MRQLAGTKTRCHWDHAAPLAGLLSDRMEYSLPVEHRPELVPGSGSRDCGTRKETLVPNIPNIFIVECLPCCP